MRLLGLVLVLSLVAKDAQALCKCFDKDSEEISCSEQPNSAFVVCQISDLVAVQDAVIEKDFTIETLAADNKSLEKKLAACTSTADRKEACPEPPSAVAPVLVGVSIGAVVGVITGFLIGFFSK